MELMWYLLGACMLFGIIAAVCGAIFAKPDTYPIKYKFLHANGSWGDGTVNGKLKIRTALEVEVVK